MPLIPGIRSCMQNRPWVILMMSGTTLSLLNEIVAMFQYLIKYGRVRCSFVVCCTCTHACAQVPVWHEREERHVVAVDPMSVYSVMLAPMASQLTRPSSRQTCCPRCCSRPLCTRCSESWARSPPGSTCIIVADLHGTEPHRLLC